MGSSATARRATSCPDKVTEMFWPDATINTISFSWIYYCYTLNEFLIFKLVKILLFIHYPLFLHISFFYELKSWVNDIFDVERLWCINLPRLIIAWRCLWVYFLRNNGHLSCKLYVKFKRQYLYIVTLFDYSLWDFNGESIDKQW